VIQFRNYSPPLILNLSRFSKLLAIFLLMAIVQIAQFLPFSHALLHLDESAQARVRNESSHAFGFCDECLALSVLGAMAVPCATALPQSDFFSPWVAQRHAAQSPAALRLAFRARAPPFFLF
jgi:hypothetical protein